MNDKKFNLLALVIGIFCGIISCYVAIKFIEQPPLDFYSFRQTQTALTSYWLIKNGFSLAYETPVGGMPWSIPFEFPLYQYITALIHNIFSFDLNAIGRGTSFIFYLLCLMPVYSIIKKMDLNMRIFLIFIPLYLTSPLYLYWGRTFMIETTALFLSLMSISLYFNILKEKYSLINIATFIAVSGLAILQKSTTALPVFLMIIIYQTFNSIYISKGIKALFFNKNYYKNILICIAPILIGFLWTTYADNVKINNEFGQQLTSYAVSNFIFGNFWQRLSLELFEEVLWNRIFDQNLNGIFGLLFILYALISKEINNRIKYVIIFLLGIGIIPLFIFTNLHIVHTYYQAGNVIYLILALSISIYYAFTTFKISPKSKNILLISFIIIVIVKNYYTFNKIYFPTVKTVFTNETSNEMAVANVIKSQVLEDKYFISYGNDWSSVYPYFSERKSFTVPSWFSNYNLAVKNPEKYINIDQLGAILSCGQAPNNPIEEVLNWSTVHNWKTIKLAGCYISLPSSLMDTQTKFSSQSRSCNGNIEIADGVTIGNKKYLNIYGWTSPESGPRNSVEKLALEITPDGGKGQMYDIIRYNRPDVSNFYKEKNIINYGFSSLIGGDYKPGKYTIRIVKNVNELYERCSNEKNIEIK